MLGVATAAALLAAAARGDATAPDAGAVRAAVEDLARTFGADYPRGAEFLGRLDALEAAGGAPAARAHALAALRDEALLANPLLRFDRLLVVRRRADKLGLPANWQGNSCLPPAGYDNEIAVLSPVAPTGALTTLLRPDDGAFVGDLDLDFDGARLLFSRSEAKGRWRVHELDLAGGAAREVPLIPDDDVDNYDPCWLPDGAIVFCSTATFAGVPCVRGGSHVGNLFRFDPASGHIRRLTFDQDHDWCPTVLHDGRILYLRWEYSDLPHFVSRILFGMNPDGTGQAAFYGSNSYWPNSMFYARPLPGSATRFVAVISGHHDTQRMGELVLFDAAKGRREADGVIQRIPGRGRPVEPVIRDRLVSDSWPKFLHPWPLSEKHFLVAAQPGPGAGWGLYLADVFDNLVLIKETPGSALLEPVPVLARARPPALRDRTDPAATNGLAYIEDVYAGPGLAGVARGAVKSLRLFTYHYSYRGMGGQIDRVGLDGPWDIKRVLGTVPVQPDGSAFFRVPANTPVAVQPLDADGQALQLMRSWFTAMPGETVSCAGCHETPNQGPLSRRTRALSRPPDEIAPWHGPTRGFSFAREVQPVLDRHCVRCHDGRPAAAAGAAPALAAGPPGPAGSKNPTYNDAARFTPSYLALRAFVRGPTIESDMHLLVPAEFHADTTRLVQMLKKGHQGVQLPREDWDRLVTWIDLNTPAHGTWTDIAGTNRVAHQAARRREMMRRYAGVDEDPEAVYPAPEATATATVTSVAAAPAATTPAASSPAAPPPATRPTRRVDLGGGIFLDLVRLPAGEVLLGSDDGDADERPRTPVRLESDFWIGACEVSNEQYGRFDPAHDSGIEVGDFLQFSTAERGFPVNGATQPVVRVTWERAAAFCRWLAEKTGEPFALPSEAQWEYACRAGTASPMWYGDTAADFAACANLADRSFRFVTTLGWDLPSGAIPPWRAAIASVDDRHRVSAAIGSFRPNPWGLYDMHGNAAEWTASDYVPYPGGGASAPGARKVVRGGSWSDRPAQARASSRWGYPPWQAVYNVGFRVAAAAR